MTDGDRTTIRLNWPQFQGGEPAAVIDLTPGLSPEEARLSYGIGGRIAALLAPRSSGPVVDVPVAGFDERSAETDGIIDKAAVLSQNAFALNALRSRDADRIVTIGGCCSVSALPFSYLAEKYGDDLAIVWLDSHPDTNLPGGINRGFNTMVVSHLIGHGDPDVLRQLPASVPASHVGLAGVHAWGDQDPSNIDRWGLTRIPPAATADFVPAVVEWIASTGCRRVALHFDLDVVRSTEFAFGMAHEPDGMSLETALSTIAAVASGFDLVGLTVAEFVSREAAVLRSVLHALPLLSD